MGLELARLGRRVVVVTVALLLLVLAVGARLAAGFTRPVMEIVEGTDRIARGATSARPAPERAGAADAGGGDRRDGAARGAEPHRPAAREAGDREDDREHHHRGGVARSGPPRDAAQPAPPRRCSESRSAPASRGSPRWRRSMGSSSSCAMRSGRPRPSPLHRRLRSAGAEDREWSVVWVPVPGGGDPAALLVVEDVTEILRAQRLEAWAEMARIIAHEVKNPLTPIRLSTEHMQQVYATDPGRFDEVFERCTNNILVAGGGAARDRLRVLDLQPRAAHGPASRRRGGVGALGHRGLSGRAAAGRRHPVREHRARGAGVASTQRLLARALRNLLENAVRASRDHGEVTVRVDTDNGTIAIDVSDRGPGSARRGHEPHLRALLLDRRRRAPGSACRSRGGSSRCTAAASPRPIAPAVGCRCASRCRCTTGSFAAGRGRGRERPGQPTWHGLTARAMAP